MWQALVSLSRSDNEQDQKLLRAVYGIAFFGVPQTGMEIHSLISIVENGPNRFLLESIGSTNSQVLTTHQREFPRALAQRDSKIIYFYETHLSPTAKQDERGEWKMIGPATVLVSKMSATHCRPWENGPEYMCAVDRSHSEMVKFRSEDSEYEKVVIEIRSLAQEARKKAREAREARELQEAIAARMREMFPILSQQALGCLKSLAFDGINRRFLEIESAASGTCEWLLQHETFKNWSEFNQELLWIKGKPGSGKSTLLKYALANQADLLSARDNDLVLSFFFHGRGGNLEKTPLGFFRSLLHKILKRVPDCLSDLVDTFENRSKEIGDYGEKWQWHPKELWSSLESSLLHILETRSVWLFVDALDECGEDNAKDLIGKFELLFNGSVSLNASSNQLRICFSCRHYPILSSPGLAEVCLEKENRADIYTYVMSEISPFEASIPSNIVHSIIDRASGIFLWARLVAKRVQKLGLDGAGPNEIKAAINALPKDLESLYDELIRGMRPASLKLIQWIYFATRPLLIEELRWAMAIDVGCSSIRACQNAADYVPDEKRMRQRVVSLSQGLAEVASSSRVQFIHQTVKDFFINGGFKLALKDTFTSTEVSIGMSHLYLFKTCIRYLAMEEIGNFAKYVNRNDHGGKVIDFPFLDYATTSWFSHMMESDYHNIPAEQFLNLFAWPSNDVVSVWTKVHRKIYPQKPPSDIASLVHLAATYGIQGVMNAMLQKLGQVKASVDSKEGNGRTPLSLAAEKGHKAIVELLLATNQVNTNAKDNWGWTPLLRAASNGHEAIVQILLANNQVGIDLKDNWGCTPLLWVAEKGHAEVAKLLLATNQININVKDGYGRTPLFKAAENGHETIVKLLLATGQTDVDLEDIYGRTPLSKAAENGHEAVVKLLLATNQVEIDFEDNWGWTPLRWAARDGNEAIINLLKQYARFQS